MQRSSPIVVGVCAVMAASGTVASLAGATTAPPPPMPVQPVGAPERAAGALQEKVASLGRVHLGAAYGCTQARMRYRLHPVRLRGRPIVRLLITDRTRLREARQLVQRARRDIAPVPRGDMPRTRVVVTPARFSDHATNAIVHDLLAGARHWIGVPGVRTIPGVSWGGPDGRENLLPSCPPVKIVLRSDSSTDQVDWAHAKQARYGPDRVKIVIQHPSSTPPSPVGDAR